MIEDKFFVYDEEDLEYHEIKGYIIVSKSLTLFLTILFIFMIFFSFATISKYLEAKSNEKNIREVATQLNSELQSSELNLYYFQEQQLIQNKRKE